jgi:adenosine/AMP kinase
LKNYVIRPSRAQGDGHAAHYPQGIEGEDDVAWRKNLLRQFGYKL